MNSPEIRQRIVEGVVFTIPRKPLYTKLGFVLLPSSTGITPEGYCEVCGTRCNPNAHHGYWPRPARSETKKRQRALDRKLYGALDYTKDPMRALRLAPFAITGHICSKLHQAIHDIQEPPKEAPDRDILEAALDQQMRIERARHMASSLRDNLTDRKNTSKQLEQQYRKASALLADLPHDEEIIFPNETVRLEHNISEVGLVMDQNTDLIMVRDSLTSIVKTAGRRLSR